MTLLNNFTITKPATGEFIDIGRTVNKDLKVFKMWKNQREIYDNFKNDNFFIMSQPPGAGKSTTIRFVAADLLRENPNLKIVIAVPQTLIAKTFSKIFLEYPDGSQVEWDIIHNLCETISCNEGGKVLALKRFLEKKIFGNNLSDRVILVTHMTLSKLPTDFKFEDTMLIIDEGHHVLYPESSKCDTANEIGKVVGQMMEDNNPTNKLWFVTATFFRGDKSPIIPDKYMSMFANHYLPLDVYWNKYLTHIKSFSYNFVIYDNNNVFEEVQKVIMSGGKRKSIIYCPYNGHLVKGTSKLQFRDSLINAIKEVWSDCKIMDLVDERGRDYRKQIVVEDLEDFDIALAVNLFNEGTDWVHAVSGIDLVPLNSLRLMVQRFGRLLRDLPGKDHIDYNVFFPYKAKFDSDDDRRVHLSKSLNALIASSLLNDAIEPIPYPSSKIEKKTTKEDIKDDAVNIDPFTMEVPDESKKQEIIEAVVKNLVFLKNTKEENPTIQETKECIIKTIETFEIENSEEIAVYISKILRRNVSNNPQWENQTIDVSWMIEAGFDKVWSDDIYSGILTFTSGTCGIKTFKEFREVYSGYRKVDEWIEIAETLAKENGGSLPIKSYLIKNGFKSLVNAIHRTPKKFQHIKQEKSTKTPDEWLVIAEKLAKENGGLLPATSFLMEKNLYSLMWMISKYPEKFQHIKQERLHKTPDEWVVIAEKLAKENGGLLPPYIDLINGGFNGLTLMLKRYPKKFKHVKQSSLVRTIDKWVVIAEKLAEENGGVLPTSTTLRNDGFSGLSAALCKYPKKFKHIKRSYSRKCIDEWVVIAEKLAEENGGVLPTFEKIKNDSLSGLSCAIYRQPEKFQHIKRRR